MARQQDRGKPGKVLAFNARRLRKRHRHPRDDSPRLSTRWGAQPGRFRAGRRLRSALPPLIAVASVAVILLGMGGLSGFWPLAEPAVAERITGRVGHVRDGDTIEVGYHAVRLEGLHAPELSDPLGHAARNFMVDHVFNRQVRCALTGERSYDREIGRCFLDGQDIAIPLIQAGLGRDCPAHSGGRYAEHDQANMPLPGYC